MARLDINNIDMDEIHVKIGGTSGTQVSMNDTDVRGMAAPDATYAGNDGLNTGNNTTIAIGEYRNGEHTAIGSFPSVSSWDTVTTRTVSAQQYNQAEARCSMSFKNDTTNSRIECSWYGGSNANYNTVYTQYINYSGYTGDINVSYTYPSTFGGNPNPLANPGSSTSYPPYGWPGHVSNTATTSTAYANSSYRKVKDTNYKIPTAGYVQFKWLVRTDATGYSNQFRNVHHGQVSFTVNFTSDSINYTSTSSSKNIELDCWRGAIF